MALWIDALAFRSGPLPSAAQQFGASHGVERDPPRGAAALCRLHEIIVRFAREPFSDEDERCFVEGAGAYFGLVLIDHFAAAGAHHVQRDGMHRIRLGAFGSFDPFASVARALNADDLRATLKAEVAAAEAEVAGEGPVSRVVRELDAQLRNANAKLADCFDCKVWVEVAGAPIEIDLTRIVEITRNERGHVLESAVRRLVDALSPVAADPELSWQAARERVFPRLVGRSFVAALQRGDSAADGGGDDAVADAARGLYLKRISFDIWLSYVVRYQERARYVRCDELLAWTGAGAVPQLQAMQNLAARGQSARLAQHDTPEGPIVTAQSRDGLDASRLLLPGLQQMLACELGSPFLVAVPHRDTLLACPVGLPALQQLMQQRVNEAVARAPHAISRALLLVERDGTIVDYCAEEDARDSSPA